MGKAMFGQPGNTMSVGVLKMTQSNLKAQLFLGLENGNKLATC